MLQICYFRKVCRLCPASFSWIGPILHAHFVANFSTDLLPGHFRSECCGLGHWWQKCWINWEQWRWKHRNESSGGVIQILNMTSHDIPWYPNFPNPQVTVLIYYWDDRDGSSFSGWWIGPKVGGDQVWSHADNRTTTRGVKRAVFLLMKPWQCWIHVSVSQIII